MTFISTTNSQEWWKDYSWICIWKLGGGSDFFFMSLRFEWIINLVEIFADIRANPIVINRQPTDKSFIAIFLTVFTIWLVIGLLGNCLLIIEIHTSYNRYTFSWLYFSLKKNHIWNSFTVLSIVFWKGHRTRWSP